jgi:hypothetical protein
LHVVECAIAVGTGSFTARAVVRSLLFAESNGGAVNCAKAQKGQDDEGKEEMSKVRAERE